MPGYRYLFLDHATLAVRASPESKTATLSADSLAALSLVRADLDALPAGSGGVHEVCVRAHNDAWIIARRSGEGRELFAILAGPPVYSHNTRNTNLVHPSIHSHTLIWSSVHSFTPPRLVIRPFTQHVFSALNFRFDSREIRAFSSVVDDETDDLRRA